MLYCQSVLFYDTPNTLSTIQVNTLFNCKAIHVTACYAQPITTTKALVSHDKTINNKDIGYFTMQINEHTPKSAWDWFILNFSRAISDNTIISGSLLRKEPNLKCVVQGESNMVQSLLQLRQVSIFYDLNINKSSYDL